MCLLCQYIQQGQRHLCFDLLQHYVFLLFDFGILHQWVSVGKQGIPCPIFIILDSKNQSIPWLQEQTGQDGWKAWLPISKMAEKHDGL